MSSRLPIILSIRVKNLGCATLDVVSVKTTTLGSLPSKSSNSGDIVSGS